MSANKVSGRKRGMRKTTPHTCCSSGARVAVMTDDGKTFVDKFRRKQGNWRIFDNHRVHQGRITRFVIVKGHQAPGWAV